jgi:hypothetical protein
VTAVFAPPASIPTLLANTYPQTTAYGVPSALALYVGFIRSRQDRKVPAEYVTPCGFPLGWWVGQQVELNQRGELPQLAARRLEATGFVWSTDPLKLRRRRDLKTMLPADWLLMAQAVEDFAKQHGHRQIPITHVTADGLRLGQWIADKAQEWREGLTPQPRSDALLAMRVSLLSGRPRRRR